MPSVIEGQSSLIYVKNLPKSTNKYNKLNLSLGKPETQLFK